MTHALQHGASSSSGSGAEPSSAPALSPHWLDLTALHAAFPAASTEGRRKAAERWHAALQGEHARKYSGRLQVFASNDAAVRLPGNLSPLAFLAAQRAAAPPQPAGPRMADEPRLPPGADGWTPKDYQRFLDTHALLRIWDAFRAARPEQSDNQLIAPFRAAAEMLGAPRALPISLRRLRAYRRRLPLDGNVDRRGRAATIAACPGGDAPLSRHAPCTPAAWELFLSLVLSANAIKPAKAWKFVAGEARDNQWDWPSPNTIRAKLRRELPEAAHVYRARGPRRMEADFVPKVQRDYDSILAGEWWSMDSRTLDFPCRVPDARKEWREARLTLSGVADMRSRSLRLTLRATEHSDGILAGVKRAMLDWGAPTDIICDNGKGYVAALIGDKRLTSLCDVFGIRLHRSVKYHAWAKPIESLWHRLKEFFDRWLKVFTGGTPDERPEDRSKEIKRNIDALPTEAECNAWLAQALVEWHATEISGSGTRGLTPNLIFEQYRAPLRQVDPALIETQCRRFIGPIKKTCNGFRLNHVCYGRWDEAVWLLPSGAYYLLKDPEYCDSVIVADLDRKPLCRATNKLLRGATEEERREAARLQSRYRKIMREAGAARDYIRETDTAQILAAKARHAQDREDDLRQTLPAPVSPPLTIVRPDLVEPSRRVLGVERTSCPLVAGVERTSVPVGRVGRTSCPPVGNEELERPSTDRRKGFARLAEKAHIEELQEGQAAVRESRWSRLNYERTVS